MRTNRYSLNLAIGIGIFHCNCINIDAIKYHLGALGTSQAAEMHTTNRRVKSRKHTKEKVEICEFKGKSGKFTTKSISVDKLKKHLDDGDLLGSCEIQCEELCEADGDLCTIHSVIVRTKKGEQCKCQDEPKRIPIQEGKQCCAPYGNVLPISDCCPIGVAECCDLTVQECIVQMNQGLGDDAYSFHEAIFGPLSTTQSFPSYALDPEAFSEETLGAYTAMTEAGGKFTVQLLSIVRSAANVKDFYTNGDALPEVETLASLLPAESNDLKSKIGTIVADWKTPLFPDVLTELNKRETAVSIVYGETEILFGSMAGERMKFVGVVHRYRNKAGAKVAQLLYLADPVQSGVSSGGTGPPERSLAEHMRNLQVPEAVCQVAFDAAKSVASTNCPDGKEFTDDSICESVVIAACTTQVSTYQTAFEAAKLAAEVAQASAKALELAQKVKLMLNVATRACVRYINPWAIVGCVAVSVAAIEYAYYLKKKALEELAAEAIKLAIRERDLLMDVAIDALKAAANACWECECPEGKCCPTCFATQQCCTEPGFLKPDNGGGTCLSGHQCCPGCSSGQKCCEGTCILESNCCPECIGQDTCCEEQNVCVSPDECCPGCGDGQQCCEGSCVGNDQCCPECSGNEKCCEGTCIGLDNCCDDCGKNQKCCDGACVGNDECCPECSEQEKCCEGTCIGVNNCCDNCGANQKCCEGSCVTVDACCPACSSGEKCCNMACITAKECCEPFTRRHHNLRSLSPFEKDHVKVMAATSAVNGHTSEKSRFLQVDPCCEDPNDPCCGSEDPCCGSGDPCCSSEDPCCGSEDPCCGSDQECCGQANCGGPSGDPHMTTFDGLHYDCQGRGHFILTKSRDMQVQARFRKQGRVALTTGVVSSEGPGSTIVELSIPLLPGSEPVALVNGITITSSPPEYDDVNVILVSDSNMGPFRITYKISSLTVYCRYYVSSFFGRYMNCKVGLPDVYRTHGTLGLLGSADDNTLNDWADPNGTKVPIPVSFSDRRGNPALDYCSRHWCIRNEAETLFTYYESGSGYDFEFFTGCDDVLTDPVDTTEASASLRVLCGADEACLIDGILGGEEAAQTQLNEQAALAAAATTGAFQIQPSSIVINTSFNLAVTVDLRASGITAGTVEKFNLYRVDEKGSPEQAPILNLFDTGSGRGKDSTSNDNVYSNLLAAISNMAGEVFNFRAVAVIGGLESNLAVFTKLNAVTSYSPSSGIGDIDQAPCGIDTCEDDGDLCTLNRCNQITGICDTEPIACGINEACDSFTGLCQNMQNIIPCIAVIDEWNNRNYAVEWVNFRKRFPQRPFCLLVPNTSIQTLPTGFANDTVNNPDGFDRTVSTTVNRDGGDVAAVSDWFTACEFLGTLSPSSVNYVGLFVDTSGSMTLNTVRASYDKFLADLQTEGFGFREVFNGAERWIDPFLTTLVPPSALQ